MLIYLNGFLSSEHIFYLIVIKCLIKKEVVRWQNPCAGSLGKHKRITIELLEEKNNDNKDEQKTVTEGEK